MQSKISASIEAKPIPEKKGPLYLNLEQTIAKKAHDETVERRKNQPKKTILEMYRTIGAVNGPGWRPKPNRPVLETSTCLMMDVKVENPASLFQRTTTNKKA